MTFTEGNQLAKKLPTLELKLEAYKQYCQHIADGWPKKAFWFDHPEITLTWATIEKYIKEEPDVFSSILMEQAEAKKYKYWFGEGKTLMKGEYNHGSPVVWQTIMRNMFKADKWDQKELEQEDKPSEAMKVVVAGIQNARTDVQSETDPIRTASYSQD